MASRPQKAIRNPSNATEQRDDHALDQQLANDLAAIRTQRCAHRKLTRTSGAAHGEKVRQIRAGNEQDQRDRAEQQPEIFLVRTDLIFEKRREVDADAGVVGVIPFLEPGCDRLHLLPRLLDGHARFQFAPGVKTWMHRASPCPPGTRRMSGSQTSTPLGDVICGGITPRTV